MALLVLLLVAEFGLRWFMGNELRTEFREQATREGVELTEDPTIAFGATPLILSAPRGTIPEVEVTTPSTLQVTGQEIIGQPGTHVVLNDLLISDPDNPVAGRMVATTEVPDEYLLAVIQQSMAEENAGGLLQLTGVTSDVAAGTLNIQFNNGMAELNLSPTPVDGQLTFVAAGASLFGFDLPGQVTDMITAALREGVAEQAAGFTIEEFTVIEGGARMRVSGENVPLSEVGNPQLQ
ncbi:DUF2993 domain-containing protein [Corynebacterium hylobatis]|uniref:DUF2993 domain-containing protein n=1 Tax=Corynebacterium hylobatis TaxID=1859290 RepID=A0A3S0C2A6_9CORY|nr:DUF2993 domain-containing protein [Corynebacterium hylobatis]